MGRSFSDIDDCLGVVCGNGGSCIDEVSGFVCACADDFEGEFCEQRRNSIFYHISDTPLSLLMKVTNTRKKGIIGQFAEFVIDNREVDSKLVIEKMYKNKIMF